MDTLTVLKSHKALSFVKKSFVKVKYINLLLKNKAVTVYILHFLCGIILSHCLGVSFACT